MESIIETLYINLPRPQAPDEPGMEELRREYDHMRDQITQQYGMDFVDRFTLLREQINQRNWEREFTFGFHACARLFLEALSDQD